MPVHDRHQIHKPAGHSHIGDVGGPHLVRVIDAQVPEQVGVNPMLRMRPAGVRLGIDRLDAHESHQPLDPLAVDPTALMPPEVTHHRTAAVEGSLQVLLVDLAHQLQILGADRNWCIIKRGPAQA